MTSSPFTARTATGPVLADLLPGSLVRDVVLTGTYVLLIAAGAQVAVFLPNNPVPITAQTLVVLVGAAALGTTRAAVGGGAYFVLGVAGVPWFAATSGATLGYIAGFVVAAWVVGRFARAGRLTGYLGTAVAMVAGNAAIWVLGASVLSVVAGLGIVEAVGLGVVPFLPGDAIKIAIALVVLPTVQRAVEKSAA